MSPVAAKQLNNSVEDDSKEKILANWNTDWSKPPFSKLESASSMHTSDIDDLYRRLLKFSRMNGNPRTGKLKKNLRLSETELSRSTGQMFMGKFGRTYAVTASASTFQQRKHAKQSNEFKIMMDYLKRIRAWKAQKRSTK